MTVSYFRFVTSSHKLDELLLVCFLRFQFHITRLDSIRPIQVTVLFDRVAGLNIVHGIQIIILSHKFGQQTPQADKNPINSILLWGQSPSLSCSAGSATC